MTRATPVDVTVIIALHNRASLIRHTLASLERHLHPGVALEVIVIDDGSTDDGVAVVQREFPWVRLERSEHAGAPAARNKGLALAGGRATLLLDSDDLVAPAFFSRRLQVLDENPDGDGALGPFDAFVGDAAFAEPLVRPPHSPYPIQLGRDGRGHLERLLGGWYFPPCAVLWRTSALERVGGQRVGLPINQDVDLTFRMLMSGGGIFGVPDAARALVRAHAGERVGAVAGSERKAAAILELRREFVQALVEREMLDPVLSRAIGTYCFFSWESLRHSCPIAARGLLDLSRRLFPDFQLPGRWPLRTASRLLGAERASRLRGRVDPLLGGFRAAYSAVVGPVRP